MSFVSATSMKNPMQEEKIEEHERAPEPTTASAAPAIQDEKAASETAERVRHEESLQKSRIETELKSQAASSAIKGPTQQVNQNTLRKMMESFAYVKMGQLEQIKAKLTTSLMQFKIDANPEDRVMLKHMSSVLSLIMKQPEYAQMMTLLQQQLGFTTLEELASAHFVPSIKEYTKEVKVLSPQYLEGLCKGYANEENQAILKQIATCLILFQTQHVSRAEYQAILEVLCATDKVALLKHKILPVEVGAALQKLFEMPTFSDAAIDSLKEEIQRKCSAAI